MHKVDAPHNDALVLIVNINTFDVKRVLIDPGSSSKIMYHSIYKKLKLPSSQVRSEDTPVFNFSGKAVWPIAIAEVLVRIDLIKKIVEFIIMNIDSLYNVILDRSWLGRMRAVASSYHQKLKFPSKYGIVELRGKQDDTCCCFTLAIQSALAE